MNTNDNIFRIDHLLRIDHLHVKRTQAELGALQPDGHSSTTAQSRTMSRTARARPQKGNARGISSGRDSNPRISELVSASRNPVNTKTTTTSFFRPSSCRCGHPRNPARFLQPVISISHPKRPDQRVECEVWRKAARENEFWVSEGSAQCRALYAKARVYWGFSRARSRAEKVWRGATGGARRTGIQHSPFCGKL